MDQLEEGNMDTLRKILEVICAQKVKLQGEDDPVPISSLLSNDLETYMEIAATKNYVKALELLDKDIEGVKEQL